VVVDVVVLVVVDVVVEVVVDVVVVVVRGGLRGALAAPAAVEPITSAPTIMAPITFRTGAVSASRAENFNDPRARYAKFARKNHEAPDRRPRCSHGVPRRALRRRRDRRCRRTAARHVVVDILLPRRRA